MLRVTLAGTWLLALAGPVPARAEVEEVEHYDSLEQLVVGADAVVLGQVVAAAAGRVSGGCGYTAATVRVDRVLAATLPPRGAFLTLEYFGFCGPLPRLGADIPAQPGVFFLRNKGVEERTIHPNATDAEVAAEAPFWRLAILAGSAVAVSGATHVPQTEGADFLAAFEGKPFGQLVAAVGAPGGQPAPAGSSAAAPSPAGPSPDVVVVTVPLYRLDLPPWLGVALLLAAAAAALGAAVRVARRR